METPRSSRSVSMHDRGFGEIRDSNVEMAINWLSACRTTRHDFQPITSPIRSNCGNPYFRSPNARLGYDRIVNRRKKNITMAVQRAPALPKLTPHIGRIAYRSPHSFVAQSQSDERRIAVGTLCKACDKSMFTSCQRGGSCLSRPSLATWAARQRQRRRTCPALPWRPRPPRSRERRRCQRHRGQRAPGWSGERHCVIPVSTFFFFFLEGGRFVFWVGKLTARRPGAASSRQGPCFWPYCRFHRDRW
jgi:hypothetical protein